MVRSGLPWAVDPVLHPYEALGVASELVPRADSEPLGAPITDVHGLDRRVGRVPTDPPNRRKGNEPNGVHVYLDPLGQLQDDGSEAWPIATRGDSLKRGFDSPPLLCHSWSSQRIARKLPATTTVRAARRCNPLQLCCNIRMYMFAWARFRASAD